MSFEKLIELAKKYPHVRLRVSADGLDRIQGEIAADAIDLARAATERAERAEHDLEALRGRIGHGPGPGVIGREDPTGTGEVDALCDGCGKGLLDDEVHAWPDCVKTWQDISAEAHEAILGESDAREKAQVRVAKLEEALRKISTYGGDPYSTATEGDDLRSVQYLAEDALESSPPVSTTPGHTCAVPVDDGAVEYDLRCAGCVALRIATEGPMLRVGARPETAVPAPVARPIEEWDEDDGPALWWRFPVSEPPHAGTPLDDDFPYYATHWTPIVVPPAPTGSGAT